jgi:hypothetical protein
MIREADPGGLGACPQEKGIGPNEQIEKEAKSVNFGLQKTNSLQICGSKPPEVLASCLKEVKSEAGLYQSPIIREADPGGFGGFAPRNMLRIHLRTRNACI